MSSYQRQGDRASTTEESKRRRLPDWPPGKWAVMLFVAGCVVAKIILYFVR